MQRITPQLINETRRIAHVDKTLTDHTLQSNVVYCITQHYADTRENSTDIFLYDMATHVSRQLTQTNHGISNTQPIVLQAYPYGSMTLNSMLFQRDGVLLQMPLNCELPPSAVSKFPFKPQSYRLFSYNDELYMLAVIPVYADMTLQQTMDTDSQSQGVVQSSGMMFNKLMVRHWDTWNPYKKRNHVHLFRLRPSADGLQLAVDDDFAPIDLLLGLETDCPGKSPGQGIDEYNCASDGSLIALCCRPCDDASGSATAIRLRGTQPPDMAWTTESGIYVVSMESIIQQSSTPSSSPVYVALQKVAGDRACGTVSHPTFCPKNAQNHRLLAYLSMKRPGFESDQCHIEVLDLDTGVTHHLSSDIQGMPLTFRTIEWGRGLSHQHCIYSTTPWNGSKRIAAFHFTLSSNSNETKLLSSYSLMLGDEAKSDLVCVDAPLSLTTSDADFSTTLLYVASDLTSLPKLACCKLDKARYESVFQHDYYCSVLQLKDPDMCDAAFPVQHTRHFLPAEFCFDLCNNDLQYPSLVTSEPACCYYFRSTNGAMVQCWYMHPQVFDSQQQDVVVDHRALSSRSVPMVLLVHGGPQGSWQNVWSLRWNMAAYAARGYAVLATNIHGSAGFGQAFTDAVTGDWGGQPFDDLMASVDFAISRHEYIDPERLAALGASYGGYMMNWINGHTNRFRCLVNHAGIFNLRNLYYTTEELWFPEWEFGPPWQNPQLYDRWSPDGFVHQWRTPTLVTHGGRDFRVCETEAIATFTALQRQGVQSQLLLFPDENHWIRKPANSLQWYAAVFAWLNQHLK